MGAVLALEEFLEEKIVQEKDSFQRISLVDTEVQHKLFKIVCLASKKINLSLSWDFILERLVRDFCLFVGLFWLEGERGPSKEIAGRINKLKFLVLSREKPEVELINNPGRIMVIKGLLGIRSSKIKSIALLPVLDKTGKHVGFIFLGSEIPGRFCPDRPKEILESFIWNISQMIL